MSSYYIFINNNLKDYVMKVTHNIEPIYNFESKILILGSFPSIKSREGIFFYNHPQNRFWKVISTILNKPLPISIQDKKDFLLNSNIALWDVIQSCEITNSSDSSIKDVTPNDLSEIINNSNIIQIFTNGNKAYTLYNKHIKNKINKDAILLPSTSPANATYTLEKLCNEWNVIKDYIFANNA